MPRFDMKLDDWLLTACLGSKPKKLSDISGSAFRARGRGAIPPFTYRDLDYALQKLRKAGKVEYLRKNEGGPGWIRLAPRTP